MATEALVATQEAPTQLIALALEKGADPDILSKLLDLRERWEAGEARKEYVAAMTAFKQEAPAVLKKCDRVDFTTAKGRTAYNYANLEAQPPLQFNISYTKEGNTPSLSASSTGVNMSPVVFMLIGAGIVLLVVGGIWLWHRNSQNKSRSQHRRKGKQTVISRQPQTSSTGAVTVSKKSGKPTKACPMCGEETNADFCPVCGTKIE